MHTCTCHAPVMRLPYACPARAMRMPCTVHGVSHLALLLQALQVAARACELDVVAPEAARCMQVVQVQPVTAAVLVTFGPVLRRRP
mgnify:CR=1 FL=1